MWWAASAERREQAIQDRWCADRLTDDALNDQANADGVPAAKELKNS